jgi:hypothetical protein
VAKRKRSWEETPEERRRQLENQKRLDELIERRLAREGITRDEAWARLEARRRAI